MAGVARTSHLPRDGRVSRGLERIGRTLLRIAQNRFVAYVLISACMALAVHYVEDRQRDELQSHVYQNCVQQEKIKSDANVRIKLLKDNIQYIVFTSPRLQDELSDKLKEIKPLVPIDCGPLQPDSEPKRDGK